MNAIALSGPAAAEGFPSKPPTLALVVEALADFGRRHPDIARLEVFGSVAEGVAGPGSDVDVLLTFAPGQRPRGLDYFGRLEALQGELAERLDTPVDLLERTAVEADPNPRRRAGILRSTRPAYGA